MTLSLAYDARFFLNWDEDATYEPMDTLVGHLEVSKQLERTWIWLFGHLFFPFFSLSSLIVFD